MTLEITRPETEARIPRYLQSGQFHDLDELLTKALDALLEPEAAATPDRRTGQSLIDASARVRVCSPMKKLTRSFAEIALSLARSLLNEWLPAGHQCSIRVDSTPA
jgi:hypothetical protein